MHTRNLAGSLKVAILINSLGAEASKGIINSLNDSEQALVQQHLSELGHISQDIVEEVAEEFLNDLTPEKGFPLNTYHQSKAGGKEQKDSGNKQPNKLKALASLEPEQIVDLIKEEHPQTIAAITLHLDSSIASKVISALPDDLIIDVSLRVANLDKILSEMITEINDVFEEILSNKKTSAVQKTNGIEQLAEILNHSDQIMTEQILDDIEKNNPELAEEIKQRMFVFEDLVLIDDKGMQKILRKVETSELALALKGATDETKQKVFKNMSKRAAEMLSEEIDVLGAVRMNDVLTAQKTINKIIQEMASANEIVISGRGGEQFIA